MNKSPIDSKSAGIRNEKLVLSLIRSHNQLSQSQLCKLTGLGSSTASYIISRLREKQLILEKQGQSSRRGPKPIIVSVNPTGCYAVSAAINPNNINIGLFDFNAQMVDKITVSLNGNHSIENVIRILQINLLGLLSKYTIEHSKIIGIGVTLSGSIAPDGAVELSSPLGWKNVPLKKHILEQLAFPVDIYDTSIRLLSEIAVEPQLVSRSILYINVANGVGSTVMLDGKLLHGATGRFGEIGHIVIDSDGPKCGCGNTGCLEAFIGGPAIARTIQSDIEKGIKTSLSQMLHPDDIPETIVEKWAQAISQGDPYAIELKHQTITKLVGAVTTAINCYDPQIVILAGYVSQACMDDMIAEIKKAIPGHVYNPASRAIDIRPAAAGKDTLIQGTAMALIQKSLEVN